MYKVASIDMNECCARFISIPREIGLGGSSPQVFQHEVCRDFLSMFSGCLAGPDPKDLTKVLVVGLRSILKKEQRRGKRVEWKFRDWIREKFFNITDSVLNTSAVEQCLKFTVAFWMEGQEWYRVGDSLIRAEFLTGQTTNLPRIVYQSHCTSVGGVHLCLSASSIRISVLDQQLSVRAEHEGCVLVQSKFVTCLPNLRKGQVVAVHRGGLPLNSIFRFYKEMRAYWKNYYGYDLPAVEPEVYYEIIFSGAEKSFIYPSFCVLLSEPEYILGDDQATIQLFLEDLRAAVPRFICGKEAKVLTTPVTKLKTEDIRPYLSPSSPRVSVCKVSVDDAAKASMPSSPHSIRVRIVPAIAVRALLPADAGAAQNSSSAQQVAPVTPTCNVAPPSESALKAPPVTDVSTPHRPSSAKSAQSTPRKRSAPCQPESTPVTQKKRDIV